MTTENAKPTKNIDNTESSESAQIIKRFIAGALCPQCQCLDKIVVYSLNEVKMAECVSCGFQQQDPAA